jgi:hypothetical protein
LPKPEAEKEPDAAKPEASSRHAHGGQDNACGAHDHSHDQADATTSELGKVLPKDYKQITSYSWDQSHKFVSLYITFAGVRKSPDKGAVRVKVEFDVRGFKLVIAHPTNGNFVLVKPNLCKSISKRDSKMKLKDDMVVLKLRKSCPGDQWSDLTDEKDKKEAARQRRLNGTLKGAGTDELLRDMYQNADDETRASLMSAWHKGRDKREGRA